MKSHAVLRVAAGPSGRFPFPRCPKCSDLLFAAAASAHVDERHVRHAWACENCGHEFMTSVKLAFRRARTCRRTYS